ncbi:MAG: hypothetical protein EXR72_24810 [Myxococcales bacterium]|nr:hypothetical protein [Myxococcales bacterium]
MKKASLPVAHPLLDQPEGALDRYVALLEEDQALRHAEYDQPDPKRRRLKVSCNQCTTPWCCNQRVTVDLVEALAIYRWATVNQPVALGAAIARGKDLRSKPPLTDSEFFRRRVTCPFLIKKQCAIFPVRPHRCRTHYMGGNPMKCRDELAPTETYEMSPDGQLLAELETIAEDVKFQNFVTDTRPTELSEVLLLIDHLVRRGPFAAPTVVDWTVVE